MRSFFSSASARGVPVTLVLSRKSFDSLAEVERRFLRDTAVRNDFRLALGEAERGRFGNHRIAELVSQDSAKGFFSRDENAAQHGERWGVGETHDVVAGRDRKSKRLTYSHYCAYRMPFSAVKKQENKL